MASGSLGTLSVDVIAQIAGLVSDMGRAQQETDKAMRAISRSTQDAMDGVTGSFMKFAELVGIGFSLEGIKSAVDQIVELDTKVEHMSATFGISVGTFSDLNAAAVLADSSLDDATSAMTRLQKAAAGAASGNVQNAESFNALGISVAELKSLAPDELLQHVATALTETAPSAERTANMMALFGRNIAGIYPILQQLAEGSHEAAEAFGAIITPDAAAKSEAYSQSLGHVKLAAQGIGQTFVGTVLPALTQTANEFAAMISTSAAIQSELEASGVAAQLLADHLDGIVEAGKTLAEIGLDIKIAGWASGLYDLTIKASGLTSVMAGVGTAAVGAVALGAAAFSGWQVGTWARENFAWTAEIGNWIGAGVANAQIVVVADFNAIWAAVKASFKAFVAGIEADLAAPFDALANKLQNIAPSLSVDFRNIAKSIEPSVSATDLLAAGMASVRSIAGNAASELANVFGNVGADSKAAGAAVDAMNNFKATIQQVDAEAAHGKLSNDEYENSLQALSTAYTVAKVSGADAETIAKLYNQTVTILGASVEQAADKQSTFNGNIKEGQSALTAYQSDLQKLNDLMDQITSGLSGPYLNALKAYDTEEDLLNKTWADAIKAGTANHALLMQLQIDQDNIEKRYVQTNDAIKQQHDQFAKLNDEINLQITLLGVLPNNQAAVTAGQAAYNAALKAQVDLYGDAIPAGEKIKDVLDSQLPSWIAAKQKVNDLSDEVKNNAAVWKDWTGIATNAFDSTFQDLNKDIIEGGSVMKDLDNVAKQTVEAILFEFEKLAIINPLLQQIFGTGVTGNLPTLGSSNLGSLFSGNGTGGIGSWASSLFGGGDAAAVSASQSVGVLASDAGSIGEAGTMWTDDFGSIAGGGADTIEAGTTFGAEAGTSFLGTALPVIGGLFAGFSEFNAAGGGVGGLAGGAAYGIGTASLAIGGAAALSGGLAAGLVAVPVVGWVALGAMVLDKMTGGGLFGTAWKPTGNSEQDFSVDASGASASASVEESKKGMLFSGRSWKTESVAEDPATTSAINSYFTALGTDVAAGAKALGEATPDLISAAFKETFDKSGKVTSQISTILGQTFSESISDFENRDLADNILALLPAAQGAQAIAAAWQSSATTLLDGSQMLLAAQVDINNGMGLFGTADTSLADIANTVESLAASGETLLATYTRLQTEQGEYTADMKALGLSVTQSGADLVTFADGVSTAFGGVSNMNAALATLYSDYLSPLAQNANSLGNVQSASQKALTGIGEDPTESMAQFWVDFQNAMPNLTPDQLAQWVAAGIALANYTNAVTQSAAAIDAAKQNYANFEISSYGDAYVSAIAGVVENEKQQIDTANKLAQATGLAGASQQDLANIMAQGSIAIGKAVADLTTGIQNDLSALGSTGIDPNTSEGLLQIMGGNAGGTNSKAAQQTSAGYDLLQKLGDYSFATGKSVGDVEKIFGINATQLGSILGLTAKQVNDDIAAAATQDAAMTNLVAIGTEQTAILQDVLDVLQGKGPSVDLSQFLSKAPVTTDPSAGGGTKPGAGTGILPPGTMPSYQDSQTAMQVAGLRADVRRYRAPMLRSQRAIAPAMR